MSLLEDVFLEDEAGEAQELERIIEGDEYDERPRPLSPNSDDNSEKEDEAEEDKRHVDPASAKPKRVVKNPRVILNPARLTGPRGIQVIPDHFKDFKFKGKGHEKEDLDLVLKKLEHWAYRLYPKFQFADCLKKIETLGNKRPVMVHLTKIRTDQFMSDETVVQRDSSDDEAQPQPVQEEDEFDKLLQQQIDLARATPGPGSARKPAFSTPMVEKSLAMLKATSSPSINDEQRERMIRNRQLAEERRLARLKQNTSQNNTSANANTTNDVPIEPDTVNDNSTVDLTKETNTVREKTDIIEIDDYESISKVNHNRLNVIDSSDEDDALVINESVAVDIHNNRNHNSDTENSDTDRHKENINNDDNQRINNITEDEENGIVSEDVEMNDIVAIRNQPELDTKSNEGHHNIERADNSDSLDIVSDINRNTNDKEYSASYEDSESSKNDDDNENLSKENENIPVHKNNIVTNHENVNEKNKSTEQDIEETVKDSDGQKDNSDSHDAVKDNHTESDDDHQANIDSNKEKVDSTIEEVMDVEFSDDF